MFKLSKGEIIRIGLLEFNAIIIAGIFFSFSISDTSSLYGYDFRSDSENENFALSYFYSSFFRLVMIGPFVISCIMLIKNNIEWGKILSTIGLFAILFTTIFSFGNVYNILCHILFGEIYHCIEFDHLAYALWQFFFTIGIPIIVVGIWFVTKRHIQKKTFCNNCRTHTQKSDFCTNCGKSLQFLCLDCGTKYNPTDKFCRCCGSKI